MLVPAFTVKNKLEEKMSQILFDDKYQYYFCYPYRDYEITISNSTWSEISHCSMKNDEVIGFFRISVNRSHDKGYSLAVMNLSNKNDLTFSRDFRSYLIMLFKTFHLRKIEFSVVIGNDIEKMYDKFVLKYGGRIVGTFKDEVKLMDNKYYSRKHYEIFSEQVLWHLEKD